MRDRVSMLEAPSTATPLAQAAGGRPRPKVTVAMPTYRRPHLIGETVRSVLNQSFRDFEFLIREDGDHGPETGDVVRSFRDSRIVFSQSGRRFGIPGILNSLLADSRGEYIIVLHDHDLFHPDLLREKVQVLDETPSALYVHAGVRTINHEGRTLTEHVGPYPPLCSGRRWLETLLDRYDCPVNACSMVRRVAYERHGMLDQAFGFLADVELWFRLSLHGDVAYVAKPLFQLREREEDHKYRGLSWELVEILLRIHDRYETSPGWRRIWIREKYLIMSYLQTLKHHGHDRGRLIEARRLFRNRGGLLTRMLAVL